MKEYITFNAINKSQSQLDSSNTSKDEKLGLFIKSPPNTTCEKVKEFRGNLISNMAHDLKTPLQSILGYSETLMNKPDISKESQEKYLEIIYNNTRNLSQMINHFFEYSRYEISDITPQIEPISIDLLAQNLFETYEAICPTKQICFKINIEENLPAINGDYMMLYRVFQNLIDNAIKFTPNDGKVEIFFSRSSEEQIKVQIKDSGMGIPGDKLNSIFNKFQMSQNTVSKNEANKGLGLGLAIVKKILSLHNSNIFVKSQPENGTTFTFFLPISN